MNIKKIVIACDHGGYELKEHIRKSLMVWEKGDDENICEVHDLGCDSEDSVDYPDFAHPLCDEIESGNYDLGILICGSGNGINMTANSHEGIRSALCWRPDIASLARQHNDANVMALPGRFIDRHLAWDCVKNFVLSDYEGGRHQRRVDKIKN